MEKRPDWAPFVEHTNHRPARAVHLKALEGFDAPGRALDLGFGAGNESVDLLDRGWDLTAVDSTPKAIDNLRERAEGRPGRLTLIEARLADVPLPTVDYIYAGYSLFFTEPERFDGLWASIRAALAPGGVFAGHLLGDRDTWAELPWISRHTEERARELLDGLDLVWFEVEDADGQALGGPKHWHVHEFIARRPR
ncbi:class I SAM-dependent methyltransferase [Phytomonospora endophytica]|uniref:SAM-dependent methyltransferase n=1 Tax=Phytomonospora endophytica TaxID=714109 RepID=A0A841FY28_9ACTN|nr:class I SAM-dependent methyltransferase [Phytomonospora endophytica]MBB6039633.1 SAM-dependent methyltransferase [Phytomonospora endophytica]GIG65648.1 methyltransferase [Phytomonospora endophytica]